MDRTLHYARVLGRFFIIFAVFAVLFTAFLLLSNRAHAADAGEFVRFRIDTELNIPNYRTGDTTNKVTVEWSCNGTASGSVQDNTASESALDLGNTLDGIIDVASASKEMTDSTCSSANVTWANGNKTISAKAYINGWVTRKWTVALPASTSAPFATGASMDYLLVVTGAQDELGNAFTVASGSNATNTIASASYSGALASSSYSVYGGVNRWYAAPTADGTLSGGKNGYVNKTSTVTWSSDYQTTSKSADFGTSTNSTYNGDALPFAVKATLNGTHSNGATETAITGSTVTAGDSGGTSCTGSGGSYYCAVPLANTGVIATATALHGFTQTLTCTYTDRTVGSDAQSTCTINATEAVSAGSGGGGGGGGITTTPTPTPTTSVEPTPTPSVSVEVTASPTPSAGPVKLYRKVSDPKVYVQGSDGMLTWVRTLEDFNAAGYKWSDVQLISGPEFAQLKIAPSSMPSKLFRKANDPKVYVQGDDGTLTWVKTLEEFNSAGYNWADVKLISGDEFGKMMVGGRIKVAGSVAFLRVRSGPSTRNAILGTVKPNQVLQFYEWKNGWYKIKRDDGTFGWVSGGYASEI